MDEWEACLHAIIPTSPFVWRVSCTTIFTTANVKSNCTNIWKTTHERTTTTIGGQTESALASTSHTIILYKWLNHVTETQKKRKIEAPKVEGNRGVWNHSSSHGQSEYTTPQIMVSESFPYRPACLSSCDEGKQRGRVKHWGCCCKSNS